MLRRCISPLSSASRTLSPSIACSSFVFTAGCVVVVAVAVDVDGVADTGVTVVFGIKPLAAVNDAAARCRSMSIRGDISTAGSMLAACSGCGVCCCCCCCCWDR